MASVTEPIHPGSLYPLDCFYRYSGVSRTRLSVARNNGIDITLIRLGKRAYVRGHDAIDFIERLAEHGKGT